ERHRNEIVGPWMAQPAVLQRKEDVDVFCCCRTRCSVGLVLCGGPSRDRLAGCNDVPIWQPVLRQSAARTCSCGVGCVLGRIRQRALTRSFGSQRTSVMMPL